MFSLFEREDTMREEGQLARRFLGYVEVQVASKTYSLPVEALPRNRSGEDDRKPGFFTDGPGRFAILVDGDASQAVVEQTIERASAEAARHISRKLLN
jgi:hypothetical protein